MVVNSLSLTQITLDLNLVKLHGMCHRGREGKVIRSWKHPPSPHTLTRLAQVPMESSHFGLYPHPKFSKLELSFKHHFEQPFWKECQQGGKKSVSSRLKCNPWLGHSSKEQSLIICRRLRRERNAENASQVWKGQKLHIRIETQDSVMSYILCMFGKMCTWSWIMAFCVPGSFSYYLAGLNIEFFDSESSIFKTAGESKPGPRPG